MKIKKIIALLCLAALLAAWMPYVAVPVSAAQKEFVILEDLPYNWDAFATFDVPADGNFDEGGWTIPADELTQDVTYFDVPFRYGSFKAGENNALRSLDGNTNVVIPVTKGSYEKVYVLASAYGGDQELYLKLTFTDGTVQEYKAPVSDWCNSGDDNKVYETSYRYDKDGNTHENTSAYIRYFEIDVDAQNVGKTLTNVTMVGPHHPWTVVFAVTLYGTVRTEDPGTQKPDPDQNYVQMELKYTDDVFSTSANPGDGEFDGAQSVFPADGLSSSVTYGDMPFTLGSFADGSKNGIKSIRYFNTDISVTRGTYRKIGFVYSMYSGDHDLEVDLIFADGTVQRVNLGYTYDWTNGGDKNNVAISSSYRYQIDDAGNYVKSNTSVYIYGCVLDVAEDYWGKELTKVRIPSDLEGNAVILAITGYGKVSTNVDVQPEKPVQYVQMTKLKYNIDAFANQASMGDGNIDGNGNTFPSDGLERNLEFNGIPFTLGAFEDGKMNAFGGDGQKLKVTQGWYETLYFLYTACGGDRDFYVDLVFTDGTVQNATLGFAYDWTNGSGGNVAVRQSYRYVATVKDFDGEAVACEKENTPVHIYACSVVVDPANAAKTLESVVIRGSSQNFIFAITAQGEADPNAAPGEDEDPIDPTEPSDPTDPTDPTDPVTPTDGTEPSEDTEPTDPSASAPIDDTPDNHYAWVWVVVIVLAVAALSVIGVAVYRKRSAKK